MALPRTVIIALTSLLASACTQSVPAASQFAGDAVADSAAISDTSGDTLGADSASGCGPAQCEDGNPCTADTCIGGQCSHANADDGSSCGAFLACKSGKCVAECGVGFLPWKADAGKSPTLVCTAEFPVWGNIPSTPIGLKDGGDGTVSDSLTGLQWQQNTAPDLMNWAAAAAYCDQTVVLGGQSDWRLPTRAELDSLIDFGRSKPSLAPALFPKTSLDRYWTSVQNPGAPGEAWGVDFSIGYQSVELMSNPRAVRCVRGQVKSPAFAKRFSIDSIKGTVLDNATKLTWQRAIDTSGGEDGQGGRTLMQAMGYCTNLTLAGGGWRLPEVRELRSLIDTAVEQPALDHAAFPSAPTKDYWSNTVHAAVKTEYWHVNFLDGFSDVEDVSTPMRVRCVR